MKHPSSHARKYLITLCQGDQVVMHLISRKRSPPMFIQPGMKLEVLDLETVLDLVQPEHFIDLLSGRVGWLESHEGTEHIFTPEQPSGAFAYIRIYPEHDRRLHKHGWPEYAWRLISMIAHEEVLSEGYVLGMLMEAQRLRSPALEPRQPDPAARRRNLLRRMPPFDLLRVIWNAIHAVDRDDFYRVLRAYGFTDDYIRGCWVPFQDNPLGYMFTRRPDSQGRVLWEEILRHLDLEQLEKAVQLPAGITERSSP